MFPDSSREWLLVRRVFEGLRIRAPTLKAWGAGVHFVASFRASLSQSVGV